MLDLLLRVFIFKGRVSRKSFWRGVLSIVSVFFAVFVLVMFIGANLGLLVWLHILPELWVGYINGALQFLALIIVIFNVIYLISICVRRFQDININPWWVLVGFTPIGIVSFVGWCLILVSCSFLKGTIGPNQYGSDPLDINGNASSPILTVSNIVAENQPVTASEVTSVSEQDHVSIN